MAMWPDEQEQRAWRGWNHVVAQMGVLLNRQLTEDHNIFMADYEVLGRLHGGPAEGQRASDLAASMSWEQSRLSHQLFRMHNRGLVERRACE